MKHCLYIHQDHQPPKLSQYRRMKYLVNRIIFHKFYVQSAIILRVLQLTIFAGQLIIFMTHALIRK